MKQMVEALEIAAEGGGVDFYAYAKEGRQAIAEASQNGLYREGYRNGYGFGEAAGKRQAIAEAEKQEPVAWIDSKGNMICTKINESCKPLYTTPQPKQEQGYKDGYEAGWTKALNEAYSNREQEQGEPVAEVTSETGAEITMSWWHEPALPIGTKLYTTPQQRTWVDLTDEDDIDWEEGGNLKDLVKAIGAKLKEKNT